MVCGSQTKGGDLEKNFIQSEINNQYLADYLNKYQQQYILKLKSTPINNSTRKIQEESIDFSLEKLLEKYKGKLVFIDFWATWCGPCRAGIEQIKPIKENLSKQDVIFVYITNETSPLKLWENMITNIKGEHYRLTNEQWAQFKEVFGINSIPHYVLIGGNGEIIHRKMEIFHPELIKEEIEKYMISTN